MTVYWKLLKSPSKSFGLFFPHSLSDEMHINLIHINRHSVMRKHMCPHTHSQTSPSLSHKNRYLKSTPRQMPASRIAQWSWEGYSTLNMSATNFDFTKFKATLMLFLVIKNIFKVLQYTASCSSLGCLDRGGTSKDKINK